ncbi:uncharacterized protein CANTADRAFT_57504 [Suhomyces tanzawaensis NRRL Y-17324]|uniref:Zn(2)-C6 fungal-type domain-containing protein n=1 Tax=Suhomyces tanzawaensis NRRL Y-17324 TaxID=984487 RepID=A0A1E4SBJ8_9ASCO|nr:uncharacterized protein CANTADRAFT_57504 [Suhomyces tanzawaensis NRRL Y-17324]ODV76772.1 hypothetical protein CANTADRAFT_57504 [Suhomyces tanzawaensis NRRL Y-17324]
MIHHSNSESPTEVKDTRIKKRKYSRGGCDECKRRKMKCDEGKPHCHNCTRLNKVCVYSKKQKFRFDKMSSDAEGKMGPNNAEAGANGAQHAKEGIAMRFYNPSGHYGNEFVPSIDNSHRQSKSSAAQQPDLANLISTYAPMVPRASFKNSIPDILSNSIASTLSTSKADMLNLFDTASLLVNDINELVALDVHNEYLVGGSPEGQIMGLVPSRPADGEYSNDQSVRLAQSDTFEKHNFRLDDLTNQFLGNRDKFSPADLNSPFQAATPDVVLSDFDLDVKNSDLIAQVVQKNKLTEPHITYLNTLTKTQLSFHIFPFASSIESNQVMRLLLQYLIDCPYLLTSLLVISSTFQYNQSGKTVHDISRKKYISVCLRSLSEVFKSSGQSNGVIPPHSNYHLKNDIEKLLLTILVLTSNFTATSLQDSKRSQMMNSWKVHLRGAKDLLTKYSSIKLSHDKSYVSGGLTLAKTWFFAMEAIATLNTALGGTLKRSKLKNGAETESEATKPLTPETPETDDHIRVFMDTGIFYRDVNPEYHDALVKIGLLIPSSNPLLLPYNLFLGYSMKIVELSHEVSDSLNLLRSKQCTQISSTKTAKLMSMIYEARRTEIIPGTIKPSYLIPPSSPGHPEYTGPRAEFPLTAYSKIVDHNNQTHYYSWLDLSEQIRVDTIYIRLLTTPGLLHLPRPHPLLTELVTRVLFSSFLIKSKDHPDYQVHKHDILVETEHFYLMKSVFDCRASMIQSAFRVCCKIVDDEKSFEMIELYYLGLVKLGNGSSLGALDLLYKNREKARKRAAGEVVEDEEDNDFQETIPFA